MAKSIVMPMSSTRVLHLQNRTEYLEHIDRGDKIKKLAAFNLLRQDRVRELSDMMFKMGLPRFLREPVDIRETVKKLASSDDAFAEAKQALCFAGTYESRGPGYGDMVSLFGLKK